MKVGLVVPVLDEAARIDRQLSGLREAAPTASIYVVDGGSQDHTVDVIRRRHGMVSLLTAPRGRAAQMNAGAHAALAQGAEVLLFVHADVRLPTDALVWIERALADRRTVAGAFRTWTVADEGRAPIWAPLLHLADVRSRYSGLPYGDQAIFVRGDAFRAVGGFVAQPLMEDIELGRRLRRLGAIRVVPAQVRVSGRRFLARPFYFTFAVNLFPLLYAAGVPAQTLRRLYGDVR